MLSAKDYFVGRIFTGLEASSHMNQNKGKPGYKWRFTSANPLLY
jgi:hypothetical protein